MKKFIFTLLFLLISTFIFSNEMTYDLKEIEKAVEDKIYYEFLKIKIPENFVDPFYEYTKDMKQLGLEIVGLGQHESRWKWFVGKKNSNGSVDLGPLMLNSYNIESEDFMRVFAKGLDKYKDDLNVYYMIICIRFYESIRLEYGLYNALQIYNGGYRTMNKNVSAKLKNTVINYANIVCDKINKVFEDYSKLFNLNFERMVNEVVEYYRLEEFKKIANKEIERIREEHLKDIFNTIVVNSNIMCREFMLPKRMSANLLQYKTIGDVLFVRRTEFYI